MSEKMGTQDFEKIYERYKTTLYRIAYTYLKNNADVEDVLQEVFLRMLTGKYMPELGKEQAYLYRCVRNLCYDEQRRRNRLLDEVTEPADRENQYAYLI